MSVEELQMDHSSSMDASMEIMQTGMLGNSSMEIMQTGMLGNSSMEAMQRGVRGNSSMEVMQRGVQGNSSIEVMQTGVLGNSSMEVMKTGVRGNTSMEVMKTGVRGNTSMEVMQTGVWGNTSMEVMQTGVRGNTSMEVMQTGVRGNTSMEVMQTGMRGNTSMEVMQTGLRGNSSMEVMPTGVGGNSSMEVMPTGVGGNSSMQFMQIGVGGNSSMQVMQTGVGGNSTLQVMQTGVRGNSSRKVMQAGVRGNSPMEVMQAGVRGNSLMEVMQTGLRSNAMNNVTSHHYELSNMLSKPKLPIEPRVVVHSSGVQTFVSPNQQLGTMGHVMINNPSLPIKRSYNGEPLLSKMQHNVNMPGFQQQPRRIVHANAKISPSNNQNQLSQNKKIVRIDPISSGRSGSKQVQTPRVNSASFETVRSKMRESLDAALRLITLQKSKCLNKEKVSGIDVTMNGGGQQLEQQLTEKSEVSDSVDSCLSNNMDKSNDVHIITSPRGQGIVQTWGQGLQVNNENSAPFVDNFFAKDDLLQGNGLTWAYDLHMDVETTANETVKEEQEAQCPILLASKIEAELFKYFGGVNKKYKEKGRSLLFNLKDPNNPALGEKVILGEITPERLCSMSAEDLASEELSQWRIAKAEELAQMVVLPDSNVRRLVKKTHKGEFQVEVEDDHVVSAEVSTATRSIPRDDSESSALVNKPSQDIVSDKFTITNDGTDLMQGLMVDDEFKDSDLPPIVSLDEFMESLDSEPPFENLPLDVKKTESPSSLLSSPNTKKVELPSTDDAKEDSSSSSKINENSNSNLDAEANDEPKLLVAVEEQKKDENEESKTKISDDGEKKQAEADSQEDKKNATKIDAVWEGSVQMSISSVVLFIGYYKSGEKIATSDWPRPLEIKGRVRLDAFEKFVQELPMSRSRSVMVTHFVLKNEQSEEDQSTVNESVHSYVSDERLGFAEPLKGVEVYFCPPNPRIKTVITKHLIRNPDEGSSIDSVNDGLLAVIVWRKVVISTNSSSSTSSRRQVVGKKHDTFHNSKYRPSNMASSGSMVSTFNDNYDCDDEDDDGDDDGDVPPGFGPTTREDDDLPEFNFRSGGSSRKSMPGFPRNVISGGGAGLIAAPPKMTRPVSQVRELIMKYGQNPSNTVTSTPSTATNPGFQTWNDDDDDIPEWQPQPQTQTNDQQFQIRPAIHAQLQQQQQMILSQTNDQQFQIRPTIHSQMLHPQTNDQQLQVRPGIIHGDARWVMPPGPHQNSFRK